ncbi:hypothetical protein ACFW6C_15650 [Streptomyces fungicidicus]|jgi:hypothetical protein|uniref:hypothetical protein n=1 Tax=Streptomyces fungicidicus TaxID=68203 RepID=UPI00331D9C63
MLTPNPHDGPSHPLRRKLRLKLILVGVVVVVVGVSAMFPPDHVSASAQALGAVAAATMALRGTKDDGLLLG